MVTSNAWLDDAVAYPRSAGDLPDGDINVALAAGEKMDVNVRKLRERLRDERIPFLEAQSLSCL